MSHLASKHLLRSYLELVLGVQTPSVTVLGALGEGGILIHFHPFFHITNRRLGDQAEIDQPLAG